MVSAVRWPTHCSEHAPFSCIRVSSRDMNDWSRLVLRSAPAFAKPATAGEGRSQFVLRSEAPLRRAVRAGASASTLGTDTGGQATSGTRHGDHHD